MANIWILKFRLCLKFKFKEVYLKAFWCKKSWEKKIIYEILISFFIVPSNFFSFHSLNSTIGKENGTNLKFGHFVKKLPV